MFFQRQYSEPSEFKDALLEFFAVAYKIMCPLCSMENFKKSLQGFHSSVILGGFVVLLSFWGVRLVGYFNSGVKRYKKKMKLKLI
jgi:hypothetical protein